MLFIWQILTVILTMSSYISIYKSSTIISHPKEMYLLTLIMKSILYIIGQNYIGKNLLCFTED